MVDVLSTIDFNSFKTNLKAKIEELIGNHNTSNSAHNSMIKKYCAFGTCSTKGSTASKVVTIDDENWTLEVGCIIGVKPSVVNTASNITLNVNNTGAKSIWYNSSVYTSNGMLTTKNRVMYFMYDGTYWVWLSPGRDSDTTTSTDTTIVEGVKDTTFANRQSVRNYVDTNLETKQDTISDLETIRTNATAVTNKEGKGKCTINNTEYEVVISNTDEGQTGKIVFVVE